MKTGLSKRMKELMHLHECKKWAYIIADLRNDINTHPKALQMAWNKFKTL